MEIGSRAQDGVIATHHGEIVRARREPQLGRNLGGAGRQAECAGGRDGERDQERQDQALF